MSEQIDVLVYKLYKLTYDEVKIIDKDFWLSEEEYKNQTLIKLIEWFYMINEQNKFSELTGKIIGSGIEVHKILGNWFQEVIYQRALEKEMVLQGKPRQTTSCGVASLLVG